MLSISKRYWRSFVDPATLAQQVTDIIVPALPIICAGGKIVTDKGKDMLVEGGKAVIDKSKDMILERCIEKLGSKGGEKAKILFDKISSKKGEKLEKALINVSKNSEDPKAKKELQQEILKLLEENPNFANEIENVIINIDAENIEQLTLGNNISSFNLKNYGNQYLTFNKCSYETGKETQNLNKPRHYNPSTLPEYSKRLKQFVDENRSEELKKALTYIGEHKILLISGVRGVGKSTLARALVDSRPENIPEPFWFDFNLNQSAKLGDILEKLASYLEAPEIVSFKNERREPGKYDIEKLTDELQRRDQVWLFFEDLSTVLEDRQFSNNEIELLFYTLRYNSHNAKIIITSRILPVFENGEDLLDKTEEEKFHLNGLKINFAVEYLSSSGLDEVEAEKLEELARNVDGHPLALKLLVKVVKEYGIKDTLKDLSRYQEEKKDIILKARKLFNKLVGDEKELLERISVYRKPVCVDGINLMFKCNTPKKAVLKLMDKSLLETDHNGNYWLHPLIQEFSYWDLKNKKEAHLLAVNYYFSVPLLENPTKKEDLQSPIEAHYHACEAEEYDLAVSIISQFNLYSFLDLWGEVKDLIEIYEKLLPKDHFKDAPLLKDKYAHGAVLVNIGGAYSQLGEWRKAINYYEQALQIEREMGNKCGEGYILANLGSTYTDLGEIRKAINYNEQALEIAREVEDIYGESVTLRNLGSAYDHLGKSRKAIEYYEQSLKIARQMSDKSTEGEALGNLGVSYNHLGETRTAIEYYKQALEIAKKIKYRQAEENNLTNLGVAYTYLDEYIEAIKYHEQAWKIAKEIGDKRGEGTSLANIGIAYSQMREFRKALQYYERSLKISKEIEDKQGEAAALGNIGLTFSHLGNTKNAIEYYKQALEVSREIGDKLREGSILGNMGLAYINIGESGKAVEFLNESLSIGKSVENPRIIEFCEQKLRELKEAKNNEISNYHLASSNLPASNNLSASKNIFQTFFKRLS